MLIDDTIRRNAIIYAGRTACIAGDETWTWRDFHDRLDALAQGFVRLGLEPGGRVAIVQDNGPRYVLTNFATWRAAGVVVGISVKSSADEIRWIVGNCRPRLLVVSPRYFELVQALPQQVPFDLDIVLAEPIDDMRAESLPELDALIQREEPRAPGVRLGGSRHEEDLAVIGYTSGTTGRPKGAMLSHRNMLASASSVALERSLTCDDQYLFATPMNHISAVSFCVMTSLVGASFVIPGKFEPRAFIELVRTHPITYAFLVPTMVAMVLEQLAEQGETQLGARALRLICYGAAPITPDLLGRAMRAFGTGFSQAYGMTEASPVVSVLPPADHEAAAAGVHPERLKSAGRPTMHARIRILDEAGQDLPVGEVGEIALAGPSMTRGYWENPTASGEAIRDGWFLSRDLGYLDEAGYLYVVGRKSDMIITGGINVYPREVEMVVDGCPGVDEVAVVGMPDDKWGEAVWAFVIPRVGSDLSEEAVFKHCEGALAGYKKPKKVVFVEHFPRTATGKVLKRSLRENS